MNKHHYAAILAGGIGSRFWPKSRTKFPKQFIDILHTGQTLIQTTYERYAAFIPKENIYIITEKEYVNIVKMQLPHIDPANILAEPSRKNTAPCVAYMGFKLMQLDPEATMIVAPSDHFVADNEEFKRVSLQAMAFVEHMKSLITLGIKPTHPNTGYGYIQHEAIPVADNIFKVKTFTEKPNNELARAFIASGDFLWNAGIFIWPVKQILKAFEQYQSEMFELFAAEQEYFNTPEEKHALDRIYPLCTNISIDYAIMEHAKNVYVIPASFGWSDLGTWNSAYDNLEKDYLGNAVAGDNVMVIDATKCMVSVNSEKLLVLQGLDDFIVVDTNDVLLICKKENEQLIKEYVAEVRRNIGDRFL